MTDNTCVACGEPIYDGVACKDCSDYALDYVRVPRDKLLTSPVGYYQNACTIVAQVRGHVDELLVKVGDKIDEFDPLLGIVHAGETAGLRDAIHAPCGGIVVSLLESGRGFTKGDVLAILVPSGLTRVDAHEETLYVQELTFDKGEGGEMTNEPLELTGERVVLNARIDKATKAEVDSMVEQIGVPGAYGYFVETALLEFLGKPLEHQRAATEAAKRRAQEAKHGD